MEPLAGRMRPGGRVFEDADLDKAIAIQQVMGSSPPVEWSFVKLVKVPKIKLIAKTCQQIYKHFILKVFATSAIWFRFCTTFF